jgi:tetratricopeptide (TPR) repeat protein
MGTRLLARHYHQAAEKALAEFDLDRAQVLLTKNLKIRPRDSDGLLLAARTARRRSDYQAFDRYLDAHQEIQGVTPAGDLEKQLLQAQEGDLAPVEARLKRRLETDDTNSLLILEALGRGSVIAVKLPEAIQYLSLALEKQPSNYLALYWRGRAWETLNQFEKASEDYEKALAVRPAYDPARIAFAGCLSSVGRVRESVGQYVLLHRRQPENALVVLRLAECWQYLHEMEKAQELVDGLLAQEPTYVPALVEKGRIAIRKGLLQEAEDALHRAIKLAPRNRDAFFVMQLCLESQGKNDEAARYKARFQEIRRDTTHRFALARQVVRNPHDPAVRYELGIISMHDGDDVQAARWFRTALTENPQYQPAKTALEAVEKHLRTAGQMERKKE